MQWTVPEDDNSFPSKDGVLPVLCLYGVETGNFTLNELGLGEGGGDILYNIINKD
jgi:hypothetical protein